MGKKKNKKFIDKRYDTIHSFKVVQRSQKDPLVADETAPQAVLVDTECSEAHEQELHKYGVYFDDEYDYLQHLRGVQESIDWENCDLEVYTIRKEDPKLQKKSQQGLVLPSSAFESYVEEPIGLLNKAAPITGPQLELDPDIVAELDSDAEGELYDPDDEDGIPDDFIIQLQGGDDQYDDKEEDYEDDEEDGGQDFGIQQWLGGTSKYYNYDECNEKSSNNEFDDLPPLEESFEDEYNQNVGELPLRKIEEENEEENEEVGELPVLTRKRKAKTNSTFRSATSSATLPRTELQKTYDAYFERFYKEEYSEERIGALDGEIIEGQFGLNSPVFLQALETTRKENEKPKLAALENEEKRNAVEWVKRNMKARNYMIGEKEELVDIELEPKLKYDLESYLEAQARASSKRRPNLPHVYDGRSLKAPTLTKKALKEHNEANSEEESSSDEGSNELESEVGRLTLKSQLSIFSQRPKDETSEDRRDRKKALKELRRMRREEKKAHKLLFKEVKKSEQKQVKKTNCRVISLTGLV